MYSLGWFYVLMLRSNIRDLDFSLIVTKNGWFYEADMFLAFN